MEKEKKEGEEKEEKGGTICQESFVFFERKGRGGNVGTDRVLSVM